MTHTGADLARTADGFDRLAPYYDLMADIAFNGTIRKSQAALLPRLPPIRRALVMGGGTGRFLAALLAHDPHARAVSIDLSPGMSSRTAYCLAAQGSLNRAELRVGSLERVGREERFDLVVTHCFLDLFEDSDLPRVIEGLNGSLETGGHWLFSDFDASGEGLAGLARRSIVAMLYGFFRTTCSIKATHLPDFQGALVGAGLESVADEAFLGGLLRTSLLRKTVRDSTA